MALFTYKLVWVGAGQVIWPGPRRDYRSGTKEGPIAGRAGAAQSGRSPSAKW